MTPAKDLELRAKYPLVFQKPLINNESIRCDDGWYFILDRLFADMQRAIEQLPKTERWRYTAECVKEKFGTLRVYLVDDNPSSPVARYIRAAEWCSGIFCDQCGSPGGAVTIETPWGGLMATRCEAHASER